MRQLISLILGAVLFTSTTFANTNLSLELGSKTLNKMRAESSFGEKRKHVQMLLTQIQNSISNMDLPENIFELPDENLAVENFRSLNEMETYIEEVLKVKSNSQKSCKEKKVALESLPTNLEETDLQKLPELQMTVRILEELCK